MNLWENLLVDDKNFKFEIEQEFWYSSSYSILLLLGAFIVLLVSPIIVMKYRGIFCFYKKRNEGDNQIVNVNIFNIEQKSGNEQKEN